MKTKSMSSRLLSMLLTIALLCGLMPGMAFAGDEKVYLDVSMDQCIKIGEDDDDNPVYYFAAEEGSWTDVRFPDFADSMEEGMIASFGNALVEGTNEVLISDNYLAGDVSDKFYFDSEYEDRDFSSCYGYWIMDDDYEMYYFLVSIPQEEALPIPFETTGRVLKAEKDGYTVAADSYAGTEAYKVPLYTIGVAAPLDDVLVFSEEQIAYAYSSQGTYLGTCAEDEDAGYGNNGQNGETKAFVRLIDGDYPDYIQVQTPYSNDWKSTVLYAVKYVYDHTFTVSVNGKEMTEVSVTPKAYDYYDFMSGKTQTVSVYTVTVPAETQKATIEVSENVLMYNYTGDGDYICGWYDDYMTGGTSAEVKLDAESGEGFADGEIDFIQVQTPYNSAYESELLYVITFEYAEPLNPVECSISFTAQAAGSFLAAPVQDVIVRSDLAESYGYTDSVPLGESVSALDVLVKAHEVIFGEDFCEETTEDFLVVNEAGFITTIFGVETPANGFMVNGGYPNDGTESEFGGYNGTTPSTTPVVDADWIDFFCYWDDSYYSDSYSYITAPAFAESGDEVQVQVAGVMVMMGYLYKDADEMKEAAEGFEDAQLAWVDMTTGELTDIEGVVTDEDGNAVFTAPEPGEYWLTAYGDEDYPLIMTLAQITILEKSEEPETPEEPQKAPTFEVFLDKDCEQSLPQTLVTKNGYRYIGWNNTEFAGDLYTYEVPEDAESLWIKFSDAVLPYVYEPKASENEEGVFVSTDDEYVSDFGADYLAGTALIQVGGENEFPEFIQVQSPYDAEWNTTVHYGIRLIVNEKEPEEPQQPDPLTITAEDLISGIAAKLMKEGIPSDNNAPWFEADMAVYEELFGKGLTPAEKKAYANTCANVLLTGTAPSDLAKNIIAFAGLGYDPAQITGPDGEIVNAYSRLSELVKDPENKAVKNVYTIPYLMIAFQEAGTTYEEELSILRDSAMAQKDSWMATQWGTDGIAPMIRALAPYKNEEGTSAVLAEALSAVKTYYDNGGSANAASDGLVLAALAALGESEESVNHIDQNQQKTGLTEAILRQANDTVDMIVPVSNTFNTEQGFRGLLAMAAANKQGSFLMYDFSGKDLVPFAPAPAITFKVVPDTAEVVLTKDGQTVEAVKNLFYFAEAAGTYTYTVSASGYESKTGTLEVTEEDLIKAAEKNVTVSLKKDAPAGSDTFTIKVKVMVPPDLDHLYSYSSDADKYTDLIVKGGSVTLSADDTVRDALVAVLDANDLSYTEESNGYFSEIAGYAEFDGGVNSGWMYKVGSKMPVVPACEYTFKGNATVVWFYTCDYTDEEDAKEITSGGSDSGYVVKNAVQVAASAANGQIKPSVKNAAKGDTVTITVTPDAGYELDQLAVTDSKGNEIAVKKNADGTYSFTMPAGKVNVEASFKKAQVKNNFTDVKSTDYFYEPVLWALENGVTDGVDAEHFAPAAVTTRSQLITFLWRAAGCPEPKRKDVPFGDLVHGSYYEKAALWAVEMGITEGTSETTFSPDAPVTRAQAVTFLYRMEGFDTLELKDNPFTDVKEGTYYYDAVLWAAKQGITEGTSETTFSPSASLTRGQSVTFLYRFMNR